MIRCPDNQINASFIDISRIKWLVFFLLWSSFFRTTSTVASSEAPADYQPAPGRTDWHMHRDRVTRIRIITSCTKTSHSHEWRVALTRLPAKLSKNGMRVYTLSDRRSKKKLRVYTASEAKGLHP